MNGDDRLIDVFIPNDDVSAFPVGLSLAMRNVEYGRVIAAEQSGAGVLLRISVNPRLMRIVALDPHYGLGGTA